MEPDVVIEFIERIILAVIFRLFGLSWEWA
jgi:hypothetical protein